MEFNYFIRLKYIDKYPDPCYKVAISFIINHIILVG